jgi:hypothetical protein
MAALVSPLVEKCSIKSISLASDSLSLFVQAAASLISPVIQRIEAHQRSEFAGRSGNQLHGLGSHRDLEGEGAEIQKHPLPLLMITSIRMQGSGRPRRLPVMSRRAGGSRNARDGLVVASTRPL